MIIQEDDSGATYKINRYENGKIWVNQQCYPNSIIIRAHELTSPWRPQSLAELTLADFDVLMGKKPSILLLGTGVKLSVPPAAILNCLYEKGIGVEFMDTRAACHTFTVLAAEERDVVACLLCC